MAGLLHPSRTSFWLLAALLFGLLVLPFLVHLTGATVLGAYSGGGASGFFADYLRGLASFQWYSWVLALGPLLIVVVWRGLVFPTSRGHEVRERG